MSALMEMFTATPQLTDADHKAEHRALTKEFSAARAAAYRLGQRISAGAAASMAGHQIFTKAETDDLRDRYMHAIKNLALTPAMTKTQLGEKRSMIGRNLLRSDDEFGALMRRCVRSDAVRLGVEIDA